MTIEPKPLPLNLDGPSPQDLDRIAAGIAVPSDLPWSPRAHAFIDAVTLGGDHPALARTGYQPVWSLDGGRRDVPIGEPFTGHAAASALVRRLNGEAAPDTAPEALHAGRGLGRPPAPIAASAATNPAVVSLPTAHEPATAGPRVPAAQLELFESIPRTKMDPAAVVTPAGSGTDADHDRTHPS